MLALSRLGQGRICQRFPHVSWNLEIGWQTFQMNSTADRELGKWNLDILTVSLIVWTGYNVNWIIENVKWEMSPYLCLNKYSLDIWDNRTCVGLKYFKICSDNIGQWLYCYVLQHWLEPPALSPQFHFTCRHSVIILPFAKSQRQALEFLRPPASY